MDNLELDKEFHMYAPLNLVRTRMTLITTSMCASISPILPSLLRLRIWLRNAIDSPCASANMRYHLSEVGRGRV